MTDQVMIGMDPHKASNTIAVLARDETLLTRRRFANSDDGFVEMLAAVDEYPNRVWAVARTDHSSGWTPNTRRKRLILR